MTYLITEKKDKIKCCDNYIERIVLVSIVLPFVIFFCWYSFTLSIRKCNINNKLKKGFYQNYIFCCGLLLTVDIDCPSTLF